MLFNATVSPIMSNQIRLRIFFFVNIDITPKTNAQIVVKLSTSFLCTSAVANPYIRYPNIGPMVSNKDTDHKTQ